MEHKKSLQCSTDFSFYFSLGRLLVVRFLDKDGSCSQFSFSSGCVLFNESGDTQTKLKRIITRNYQQPKSDPNRIWVTVALRKKAKGFTVPFLLCWWTITSVSESVMFVEDFFQKLATKLRKFFVS
ncbi:hypothetical protein CEXT_741201 [Caerostris extrusa]|uniref:LAGLIDADG homing endonuclease n=1 Tax=Caerostris extrusa TaxID=172846 RepID=A0AAV4UIK9_CAEEX|nr:hypothetical protein CEXT_741201 [Caerostris extrusa]